MISHIHSLIGISLAQPRWPLLRTRESRICGTERRLPELRELIEDPWHFRLIGVVVHEDHDALLPEDHGGKHWPIRDTHWNLWRVVSKIGETRGLQGRNIVGHLPEITIANKESHNVKWMCADPIGDVGEVGFCAAGIEQVAGCVTVIDSIIYEVCLALKHTYAIIQLSNDAVILIRRCVVRIDEWRIVGGDVCNIAILPRAELGIVVARLRVYWLSRRGGCTSGCRVRGAVDSGGCGGCALATLKDGH